MKKRAVRVGPSRRAGRVGGDVTEVVKGEPGPRHPSQGGLMSRVLSRRSPSGAGGDVCWAGCAILAGRSDPGQGCRGCDPTTDG